MSIIIASFSNCILSNVGFAFLSCRLKASDDSTSLRSFGNLFQMIGPQYCTQFLLVSYFRRALCFASFSNRDPNFWCTLLWYTTQQPPRSKQGKPREFHTRPCCYSTYKHKCDHDIAEKRIISEHRSTSIWSLTDTPHSQELDPQTSHTVLASRKLTVWVRPFNRTRQAAHASAGYQRQENFCYFGKLLTFVGVIHF